MKRSVRGGTTAAPAGPVARGVRALLLGLPSAASLLFVAAYVGVALARMTYPFELEWIEAGMVESARRVSVGQPLYAAPSLEYVAFNYTPLYAVMSAPLVSWFGPTFFPLRLLSFVASLAVLALIFLIVVRETRSRLAGVVAAGLFAACYRAGGTWLDIARPDSLYLALLLGSIAVLAFDASPRRGPLCGGLLLALAFLTKQSALAVALPLFAYFAIWDRKRLLGLALGFLGLAGGVTLAWDLASGGWFRYFAFAVASRHQVDADLIPIFWTRDLLPALPIAVVLALAGLIGLGRASEHAHPARRRWFYAATLAGLFLSSWWLRCFDGGYLNVLMTAHAAIAIAFGFGCARWLQPGPVLRDFGIAVAASLAVVLQLAWLAYDPRALVPGADEVKRGRQLIQIVSSVPGDVLVPSHVALAPLGGKPRHFHGMAMTDVLNDPGPTGTRMAEELESTLREHRYPLIILNRGDLLLDRVLKHYTLGARITGDSTGFWMSTGMRTRPEYLAVPSRETPGGSR